MNAMLVVTVTLSGQAFRTVLCWWNHSARKRCTLGTLGGVGPGQQCRQAANASVSRGPQRSAGFLRQEAGRGGMPCASGAAGLTTGAGGSKSKRKCRVARTDPWPALPEACARVARAGGRVRVCGACSGRRRPWRRTSRQTGVCSAQWRSLAHTAQSGGGCPPAGPSTHRRIKI